MNIVDLAARLGLNPDKQLFIKSIYKQENTPSLRLYPKKNSYNDFSVDKGGDIIRFYQDYYNLEFKDAVNQLADLAGIVKSDGFTPEHKPPAPAVQQVNYDDIIAAMDENEKYMYYERLGLADKSEALKTVRRFRLQSNIEVFTEFYEYCTCKGFDESAAAYLLNERQLSLYVINRLKIFTIRNYYECNTHLKKKFSIQQLQKSGLYNEKGNLIFNKHRIIIPYLWKDKLVYLRARYFDELSSPKTDKNKYSGLRNDALDLNRSRRFYNYDVLAKALPGERIYITEGEFDTIAIESMGYNAICIPGAGNTPARSQFNLLSDLDVVLCMDNDEAGSKLKNRLKEIFFSMGKEFKIKDLPTKDANDFLVKYGEEKSS